MTARLTGTPVDIRTSSWLSSIPQDLQERLSRNGLVELKKTPTLEELFDEYWEAEYYELKRRLNQASANRDGVFLSFATKTRFVTRSQNATRWSL